MADVYDTAKRSEVMRKVRSKGNKSTELKLICLFKENGITGWRRNYHVKGHPDFVFLDKRVAVFVDGCFWHGHDCRKTVPKQNAEFWERKIARNKAQDQTVTALFIRRGWDVLRIWECELKSSNKDRLLERLRLANLITRSGLDPERRDVYD